MTDLSSPPVPTPEKASVFEDFIDIFVAPGKVFARRANSGFFLVMCVVTLLIGGLFLANRGVMQGIMDAEYARQTAQVMKQNPNVTPEQLERGKGVAEFFQNIGIFIGIPIAILLVGLLTWLTGKLVGASLRYSAATMIAAYAYMPKVVESLGMSVQGLLLDTGALTGRFQLSLGVGRFLDPEMSPGLLGLLGRIDIFTLWVTVLIAIGIGVVGKVPREKTILAGVIVWSLGALGPILQIVMAALRG